MAQNNMGSYNDKKVDNFNNTADSSSNAPNSLKDEAIIANERVESPYNAALARRVTRKCDFRLVPILGLLYFTAFLDRSNIANAKLYGLEKGLNMPSNGYNTALWVFYLTYILFEVPSNLFLSWSKMSPRIWIGFMTLCLAILTMCQGLTRSAAGLYVCRTLMGIFVGGVAPAAALLLGQYYRRSEYGPRYAIFVCFALVGSAVSSFLGYAISHMDGVGGYASWRWIFILEGSGGVIISMVSFFVVPNFPAESKFLTLEEKEFLLQRLEDERGVESTSLKDANLFRLLTNWKVWMVTFMYFGANFSAASVSSFSPTVLNQLGWTANEANLRNIPIWLVGAVTSYCCTLWSAKINRRYPFIFTGFLLCIVGMAIQLTQVNPPGVRYFGIYLLAVGSFVQQILSVVWLNNNLVGRPQRAVGAALQLGFGNSCNFVVSNIFITEERPKYPTAFKTGMALTVAGGVVGMIYYYLLWAQNKKYDRMEAAGESEEGMWENGQRFRNTL